MSSVPSKSIDGDVAIGRNATAGGNATIRGSAHIGHNLVVDGWLDARNIVGLTPTTCRIEIDNDGMDALAWGETMTVRCTVFKGWQDMSALVTGWKVERDTGDAADDAVWNASAKARAFDGTLVIEHTAHRSDLGADVSTVFTVTAYLKDGVKTQYTIEL